ncbi:fungal-specific transcription factor domain-containing protein [Lentinula edodes]|uniref:fungal-specific transcription factor domain-containing protein n=1 Tax=Lentinula edodes TaxID=5353 RepID=UPI001E8CB622|nr:fungal-specific transcription factor domain-containing protein [Lentinula edodes]KAH7879364.1 fungal-specific transcription factor domain-containing protein [Lentinula edodes]
MSSENESTSGFHSFRQMSSKEKTDLKRIQGQISCAECCRLKYKCDKKKQIPCGSCVKRGCSSLCPTQALSSVPVKGAMTSDVAALRRRIRQLEDALSALQATTSSEPHSLLAESLCLPKAELRKNSYPEDVETSDMADALGTLTLGKLGDARYLGRSAGSESLLEDSPEVVASPTTYGFVPSNHIAQLVNSFPFLSDNTWDVESSVKILLSHLPQKERAWNLAESYLTRNFWYMKMVSREELVDELLTPAYRCLTTVNARPSAHSANAIPISPSRLSLLFICLAHGSLADYSMPMYSSESAIFFNLSRACLSLHPVFVSPDLASLQAVTLIGYYYDTGGPNYSIEAGWVYMSIAAKLTHSLGLHRESVKWGLDDKTIQRRRTIFWELYTFDGLTSLALGRPPALFAAHSNTPLPIDTDDGVDDEGNLEPGFHHWRMTFSRDVITAVAKVTLSPGMPDYQSILDLDQLVREHPLPREYDPIHSLSLSLEKNSPATSVDEEEEQVGYEASMIALKGLHLNQFRAVVIIHIHRAFFAQVLLQSPSDPLNSIYAPSFLAAYRTSSMMVHLNVKHFYKYSEILSRYWEIWTGLLSAGIILGLIVARSPRNPVAANAYAELGLAIDLFKMGAPRSARAKRGLNVLLRMYEKATKSINSQVNTETAKLNVVQEDADALHTLETFAGYTKLLMKKMRSSRKIPKFDSANSGSEGSGQHRQESTTSSNDWYINPPHSDQQSEHSFSSYPSNSPSFSVPGPSNNRTFQPQSERALPVGRHSLLNNSVSTRSGVPFEYNLATSQNGAPAWNHGPSSTGSATQHVCWNDRESRLNPLAVHRRGGYDARPSWTSTQAHESDPSVQPGTNQGWRHVGGQNASGHNASTNQIPFPEMDVQWVELMQNEGVYGVSEMDVQWVELMQNEGVYGVNASEYDSAPAWPGI